jgi:hypothetical protein
MMRLRCIRTKPPRYLCRLFAHNQGTKVLAPPFGNEGEARPEPLLKNPPLRNPLLEKSGAKPKVLFNTGTSAVGATVGLKLRKKPAP